MHFIDGASRPRSLPPNWLCLMSSWVEMSGEADWTYGIMPADARITRHSASG